MIISLKTNNAWTSKCSHIHGLTYMTIKSPSLIQITDIWLNYAYIFVSSRKYITEFFLLEYLQYHQAYNREWLASWQQIRPRLEKRKWWMRAKNVCCTVCMKNVKCSLLHRRKEDKYKFGWSEVEGVKVKQSWPLLTAPHWQIQGWNPFSCSETGTARIYFYLNN